MNPKNFFGELKRRNVYKVAIAYAVVAWLLMQIATQVFPFLEIPNWAIRLVIMLIVIGFPIALAFFMYSSQWKLDRAGVRGVVVSLYVRDSRVFRGLIGDDSGGVVVLLPKNRVR
jgi:hypothetical protein